MENEEDLSSFRVLIVDDDENGRELISGILGHIGVGQVLEAESGERALALLEGEEGKIDLILCDIEMPVMKGYELVRRIRYGTVPKFKDVPILMLTAHDTARNVRQARVHKVSGFIPKTAMLEHLEKQIRRLQLETRIRDVL